MCRDSFDCSHTTSKSISGSSDAIASFVASGLGVRTTSVLERLCHPHSEDGKESGQVLEAGWCLEFCQILDRCGTWGPAGDEILHAHIAADPAMNSRRFIHGLAAPPLTPEDKRFCDAGPSRRMSGVGSKPDLARRPGEVCLVPAPRGHDGLPRKHLVIDGMQRAWTGKPERRAGCIGQHSLPTIHFGHT